jgi:hypothetical protein
LGSCIVVATPYWAYQKINWSRMPNAGRQARLKVGARHERTLAAMPVRPGVRTHFLKLPLI